jgi:hypothetical protein
MWAVEAKNFGPDSDYFYISGITQKESRLLHSELSNSGEWAFVRSWDKIAEWEREKSNERIRNWKKDIA